MSVKKQSRTESSKAKAKKFLSELFQKFNVIM